MCIHGLIHLLFQFFFFPFRELVVGREQDISLHVVMKKGSTISGFGDSVKKIYRNFVEFTLAGGDRRRSVII